MSLHYQADSSTTHLEITRAITTLWPDLVPDDPTWIAVPAVMGPLDTLHPQVLPDDLVYVIRSAMDLDEDQRGPQKVVSLSLRNWNLWTSDAITSNFQAMVLDAHLSIEELHRDVDFAGRCHLSPCPLFFFPSNAFLASARSLHTFNRGKQLNCTLHAGLSLCRKPQKCRLWTSTQSRNYPSKRTGKQKSKPKTTQENLSLHAHSN